MSWATDHMGRDLHLQNRAPTAAGSVRSKYFGDEPIGRVYIDTLSSVSCSFWSSDIDAQPLAALWSGKRGGVERLRAARSTPRSEMVAPSPTCHKAMPEVRAALPAGHDPVITSSVRCPVLVHGNAYPTMELRQSSQTNPDCCPMGRVTQFGVNADLVPLGGDACVEGLP